MEQLNHIQERCQKAQFAIAKKRSHFGIHTDDVQKILINLSTIAGGLSAADLENLGPKMQEVEKAISYSSSLYVLKTSLERLVDGASDAIREQTLREHSMRRSSKETAIHNGFKAAYGTAVPLHKIGEYQASHPVKK